MPQQNRSFHVRLFSTFQCCWNNVFIRGSNLPSELKISCKTESEAIQICFRVSKNNMRDGYTRVISMRMPNMQMRVC